MAVLATQANAIRAMRAKAVFMVAVVAEGVKAKSRGV
jgi:hypothetical protein